MLSRLRKIKQLSDNRSQERGSVKSLMKMSVEEIALANQRLDLSSLNVADLSYD